MEKVKERHLVRPDRRRREEEDVSRRVCESGHTRHYVARKWSGAGEMMSLVDDQHMNWSVRPCLWFFVGMDSDRGFLKRTGMELIDQLLGPLLAKVVGNQNQHLTGAMVAQGLPDECSRLDGLAQADFIGQQVSTFVVVGDAAYDRELVVVEFD